MRLLRLLQNPRPFLVLFSLVFGLMGCAEPEYRKIQGETMGTYYATQAAPGMACDVTAAQLDAVLGDINRSMSTYIQDSELSLINASSADQWLPMSSQLIQVVEVAEQLWQQTSGAFDVTVGPLVNLWGFGPEGERSAPSLESQAQARARVGMELLRRRDEQLLKTRPGMYIDLSALAKGYAVDRLAQIFMEQGCQDFMVDIGGEMRMSGVNAQGQLWRIGIEVPDPQAMGMSQDILSVSDISIATSGDYRNFHVVNGERVDHVIDPRSGLPADNLVVSATVLHPSAMWADAYATALMVMGMEEGLAFANRMGIPAYLIARTSLDQHSEQDALLGFKSRYNEAMGRFLQ